MFIFYLNFSITPLSTIVFFATIYLQQKSFLNFLSATIFPQQKSFYNYHSTNSLSTFIVPQTVFPQLNFHNDLSAICDNSFVLQLRIVGILFNFFETASAIKFLQLRIADCGYAFPNSQKLLPQISSVINFPRLQITDCGYKFPKFSKMTYTNLFRK